MPLFTNFYYWTNWFQEKIPVSVLYLVDLQGHLADGEKNDGTFICTRFIEHMKKRSS